MAALVSKFITQTLCDHQGRLDFLQLESQIARRFTVDTSVLRTIVFDERRIAIRADGQTVSGDRVLSPDSLLVAKTSVRVCKKVGECSDCDSLHLCRFFICGNCSYGDACRKSHNVDSVHNTERLKKHNLDGLTEKQLFQLLLQNDPSLLPEICTYYNKGNGLHGSCTFTNSCTKLHVCRHHFQGNCAYGSKCKRVHQVEGDKMKGLRGVSPENIRNLPEIYTNRFIISGQQEGQTLETQNLLSRAPQPPRRGPPRSMDVSKTKSDKDKNEICLFFISGRCSFKEGCVHVHWRLPYRWQVLRSCTDPWEDPWEDFPLAEQEQIERAYAEPGNNTSSNQTEVSDIDFTTMMSSGLAVRRLSTASAASKPSHSTFTTHWLWYWKDDSGNWVEFGQTSPSSLTLEGHYLADRDLEFSVGSHQYVITVQDVAGTQRMYQQNIKTGSKREVRRRPVFMSARDVDLKCSSAPPHSSDPSTTFPFNWDKKALPDFGYKLVPLESTELAKITELFKRTLPRSRISCIQRVQNPSLWKFFQLQKEQMKKRNGVAEVREKLLFHATDESLTEAVCEQNFDWRVSGAHGTAHGKGGYFTRDAFLADKNARYNKSTKITMFVARVLVGEFTRGQETYMRPPQKANSKHLYDSCVDQVIDPSVFVIFEKQQIYPEYIINYE